MINIDALNDDEKLAALESIHKSIAESKEIQRKKITTNVEMIVKALKKIEADLKQRYDETGNLIANLKSGEDGRDGRDGKDGKDGRAGKDGAIGPRGYDGLPGRNGLDGQDGVSITDAHIDFDGSLIISLSTGRVINVGEVVTADIAEKIKVITNGGGTSQYVLDTLASLQAQISGITSGLDYQGTWNASTNTPTLTSSVGTNGYYYIVSVAGSTNLNGVTDWQVGDWAVFNGTVWQKLDQTDIVTSVAGRTGAVVLTTADIGGLGTIATQAANNVTITGGSVSGITDLAIADGGTGASTAANARTNLGLVIGTDVLSPTGSAASLTSFPTFNQNTTGTAANVTGTVAVANGGTGATTAATARTNLGATTVGASVFTLTNPSAITFPRFNADNTVSALDAATFRTAIGAGTSSTTGTVTSVAATVPTFLSISGSPITSSGTLAITLSGTALPTSSGGTGLTSFTANGVAYASSTSALATGSALTFDGTNFVNTAGFLGTTQSGATSSYYIAKNSVATSGVVFGVLSSGNGYLDVIQNRDFLFAVNDTEQMRLTSTGLGIGTSSPSVKLQVGDGTAAANWTRITGTVSDLYIGQNTAVSHFGFTNAAKILSIANYPLVIGTANDYAVAFGVNNAEQMRLTSTGLGIGTSSPAAKLHVSGQTRIADSSSASNYILIGSGANAPRGGNSVMAQTSSMVMGTEAASNLLFITNATEAARLDSSGNLGLGVTPSAWKSTWKATQIGSSPLVLADAGSGYSYFGQNWYYNASNQNIYINNGYATSYAQDNGKHQWFIAPSGTAGNAITFTQAMTLTAGGKLLVGTTTDFGEKAVISAANGTGYGSTAQLRISGGGTNNNRAAILFSDDALQDGKISYYPAASAANSYFSFSARSTESDMILDGSGNLLIGTSDGAFTSGAGFKFGVGASPASGTVGASSSNGDITYRLYSTGAAAYRFYVGFGGTIYATSTSISAISDRTLKDNIRDLDTGLTEVMALKPRRFDWKNGDAQNVAGFVAQEVEEVLPELVTDYQYSDTEIKKSLKMGDILPTLVKAIQEQQLIIESLTQRIATLETK
jgi:hypothetical protein